MKLRKRTTQRNYLRLTGQAYYGLLAWLFVSYCRLLVLIVAYWPGLLWLTGLVICGLLVRLIMAYWPGCFMVTAGFLGLLIAAYWPGLMWLTGLAYCNTLSAY